MSHPRIEAIRAQIAALPASVREVLTAHRFDEPAFLDRADRWLRGKLVAAVTGRVAPLADDAIVRSFAEDSREHAEAAQAGTEAIRRGEVAAIVMNGGMSTRFGGVVKGTVPALGDRTFLGLKLDQVARLPGTVPVFLMNSFATAAPTEAHLRELEAAGALAAPSGRLRGAPTSRTPVECFAQGVAVRLTPGGDVFLDPASPAATLHAPGHGDLPSAFRASGLLDRFVDSGGRWVVVSNVDNVGATVDPAIVGQVIASGRRIAVELARREVGDTGGMPATVDGRPQVLESFRFPAGFDDSPIAWFNTNTFIIEVSALAADHELTWFPVHKKVSDRPVIQFERLIGELSAFVEPIFLGVPRSGPRSRFLPVKAPADLEARRSAIAAVVEGWGTL